MWCKAGVPSQPSPLRTNYRNTCYNSQKREMPWKRFIFTTKHYVLKVFKINSPFYKESIKAMTTLDLRKQVLDQREEKLFYNPIFQGKNKQTLKITKPCETAGIFTYGKLLDKVKLILLIYVIE